MWQTIYNWPWGTIWSAVSAIATAVTAIVAGLALFQWSRQEKLKVKMEFRRAISTFSDYLAQMPGSLADPNVLRAQGEKLDQLTTLYIACAHAWLATEDLLVDEEQVSKNWDIIVQKQGEYLNGEAKSFEVNRACREIMAAKFVFK